MELRITKPVQLLGIVAALLLRSVICVPMKYEVGYRNSIDLDAEQTEARYDQGLLSDIMNDERVEVQKAESCTVDNYRYDHGQKVQRDDPCEICLCIDGEIFCWWKQCDTVPAKPVLTAPHQLQDSTITSSSSIIGGHHPLTTLFPIQPQLPVASAINSQTPWSPIAPYQLRTSEPPLLAPAVANPSTTTPPPAPPVRTTSDKSASFVVPSTLTPSTFPEQPDAAGAVRVLHSQPSPVENIPQNILTFPQSPPIMMYRPASGFATSTKNGTVSGDGFTRKRAGPGKKVKSQDSAKKPFRKSPKSKGFVLNYDRFGGMAATRTGGQRSPESLFAVTERVGLVRSGSKIRQESMEDDRDEDEDESDDDDDDDGEEEDSGEEENDEKHRDVIDEVAAKLPDKAAGTDTAFGGFGYGMIKEAEVDKQQHYIITSSGHVEMFDDGSMETTEGNAFGINQFSPQSQQQQQVPISAPSSTFNPMEAIVGRSLASKETEGSAPIPPMITLTTNVTQNSNYSYRAGGGDSSGSSPSVAAEGNPPLTAFASIVISSSGSVIDVLNSTSTTTIVDGGDYLDDNQTELIYPAVPGLSGHSSGSSSSSSSTSSRSASDEDSNSERMLSRTTDATSNGEDSGGTNSPEQHCVVMGVSYAVGAVLKQETGNCLHCVCVAGPENDPLPRVTCTPLNCPPLILPDILDGAGF